MELFWLVSSSNILVCLQVCQGLTPSLALIPFGSWPHIHLRAPHCMTNKFCSFICSAISHCPACLNRSSFLIILGLPVLRLLSLFSCSMVWKLNCMQLSSITCINKTLFCSTLMIVTFLLQEFHSATVFHIYKLKQFISC